MIKRRPTNNRGIALLSVLVIGTLSIFFLLALASIVTSAVRATASHKWAEGLRNCAEIGIDYAVDKFNSVYPCPLDPTGSGSLTTLLPTSELQAGQVNGVETNPGVPNVKVEIKVTRLEDSDWPTLSQICSVYSPQLDPTNSVSQGWNSPASTNLSIASGGGFRVVESKASNGVLTKTIRVILKARFDSVQPDGSTPLLSGGGSTPVTQSYFQQPLFGNSNVSLSGPVTVKGFGKVDGDRQTYYKIQDPIHDYNNYFLNVSTNRLASIGAGTKLTGNVVVTSSGSGANNVVTAPGGTIEGRVLSTGNIDTTTVTDYTQNGNVQARADNPNGNYDQGATRYGSNKTPISTPPSSSQYQMAPVSSPASATFLDSLSNYVASDNKPTDSGTTFQTNSLSTSGIPSGKSVSFENSDNPVQIYINQGVNSTDAVAIDTSRRDAKRQYQFV